MVLVLIYQLLVGAALASSSWTILTSIINDPIHVRVISSIGLISPLYSSACPTVALT